MKRMQAFFMVVRYVPRILREEFVNVGVVLSCPEAEFQDIVHLPSFGQDSRAKVLDGDGLFVRHTLTKLRNTLQGKTLQTMLGEKLAPESRLTLEGMFALHHAYCNNIQFSSPRTVLTDNPANTLQALYMEYVGEHRVKVEPKSISRTVIRRYVHEVFEQQGLFDFGAASVSQDWRLPIPTEPTVDLAYKNDVWHCYQAISFAVRERDFTTTVNAYRTTARDAQQYGGEVSNARFMALVHRPSHLSDKVKNLEIALEHDGIEVTDYREAPEIAKDIRKHLEAHALLRG